MLDCKGWPNSEGCWYVGASNAKINFIFVGTGILCHCSAALRFCISAIFYVTFGTCKVFVFVPDILVRLSPM